MNCETCGKEIDGRVLEAYRADDLVGLANVTVVDEAREYRCDCGETVGVSVPDVEALQVSLAVLRVTLAPRLAGDEIRFLRHAVGLKAKDLARVLEVTPETVSRWENGHKVMEPEMEKLLRLAVGITLAEQSPSVPFSPRAIINLALADAPQGQALAFECRRIPVLTRNENEVEEHTGWRMLSAAA